MSTSNAQLWTSVKRRVQGWHLAPSRSSAQRLHYPERESRGCCVCPNTFISWVTLMISDRYHLFEVARKIPKESNKFVKLTFETIVSPTSYTLTISCLENTTSLHPSLMSTSLPSFDVAPFIVYRVLLQWWICWGCGVLKCEILTDRPDSIHWLPVCRRLGINK